MVTELVRKCNPKRLQVEELADEIESERKASRTQHIGMLAGSTGW